MADIWENRADIWQPFNYLRKIRRTYGNFMTFALSDIWENMADIWENMADIWEHTADIWENRADIWQPFNYLRKIRRTYGNFTTFSLSYIWINMAVLLEHMADIWKNKCGHMGTPLKTCIRLNCSVLIVCK
jgi:2-iminoacetate synthase ThiH